MKNTVVLTVHNKESTIQKILDALIRFSSNLTDELIVVLDGCTDKTKDMVFQYLDQSTAQKKVRVLEANDVWETKANNLGLREVLTDYATIIQDDMLICHQDWDKKLIDILERKKIFAVSGRASLDFSLENNTFSCVNISGREFPLGINSFIGRIAGRVMAKFKPYFIYKYWQPLAYATTVNRGPLMMRVDVLKKVNFFDEEFAPFELDDVDLCCRVYKNFGLLSASLPIYYIELNGSKLSNPQSKLMSDKSIAKNTLLLMERHSDLAKSSSLKR